MSAISKDRLKWVAIISFLLLVFVPGKIPMPLVKNIAIGLFGAITVFSQLMSLKDAETKSQYREGIILLVLSVIIVALFFII